MKWRILLTPTALKLLAEISDRRIREKIGAVIKRLAEEPEKQGKALLGELSGLRSISRRVCYLSSRQIQSFTLTISCSGARQSFDNHRQCG